MYELRAPPIGAYILAPRGTSLLIRLPIKAANFHSVVAALASLVSVGLAAIALAISVSAATAKVGAIIL